MTKCVLCNLEMRAGTKPWYIIDRKTGQVLGKAHSGCRNKLSEQDRLATLRAPKYKEKIPSEDIIKFGLKCGEVLQDFRAQRGYAAIHHVILLNEAMFKVSSVEEMFSLPRVQKLMEHWVYGSKIMSLNRLEKIKRELLENLTFQGGK